MSTPKSKIESSAEFAVGLDKSARELEAFLDGKTFLTTKEAFELWNYSRSRTRFNIDLGQMTSEEVAWRKVFEETDRQLLLTLGPEKKAEMDSLVAQRDAVDGVAQTLDRLANEPLPKRLWITFRIRLWKLVYRVGKLLSR